MYRHSHLAPYSSGLLDTTWVTHLTLHRSQSLDATYVTVTGHHTGHSHSTPDRSHAESLDTGEFRVT